MLNLLTGRANRRALIGSAVVGVLGVAALAAAFSAGASAHRQKVSLSPGQAMLLASGQTALLNLAMVTEPDLAATLGLRGRLPADSGRGPRPLKLEASVRDLDCMTSAVYYEARGESASGQAAVAQVVLNRVRHRAFPKTVCGVVYQRNTAGTCQFSFACDGSTARVRDDRAWARAGTVAKAALDGAVMTAVGEATHFHTLAVAPNWGPRLLQVGQVGFHVFYRFGGAAGAASAFTGTPRPSGEQDGLQATPDPEVVIAQAATVAPVTPPSATAAHSILQTAAPQATSEAVKPAPVAEAAAAAPASVRVS